MDGYELRVVRDREAFRYGVHLVRVDAGTGCPAGWVPSPLQLVSETSEGLAVLVEELCSVWERGVIDRDDLDGLLELTVPEQLAPTGPWP